jgi:hypothetical protein
MEFSSFPYCPLNEDVRTRKRKYSCRCKEHFLEVGPKCFKSRDSLVGIALGYGLNDRGSRVRFSAEAGNFFFAFIPERLWGPPTSYPISTRGSFPGGKAAGA